MNASAVTSTKTNRPRIGASDECDMKSDTGELFRDGTLPPILVRASAGTGKTYRLTARLLQILIQGGAPETILATTFTRKAAGEILDRVLVTLAKASTDAGELAKLRQQVGIETLPHSICLQLLHRLVANIHRLRICTLDSLFTQLARSFPFELALPPAWRLTDEIEEEWLKERAVDAVIAHLDPGELTTVLSMLGKGDIKRSIARELLNVVGNAYTVQRQCKPDVWSKLVAPKLPEQAALTQAAGMLRTAQAKGKQIPQKLESVAGIIERGEFDLLSDDTLIHNIAKARRTKQVVKFGQAKMPEGVDPYLDVLYDAVRSVTLAKLASQNVATSDILSAYDYQISQLKESLRVLSFDDVAIRLASTFSSLDRSTLSRRMDGAIDHVLLDEFQDTSPAQWQVLRPLALRVTETDESTESDASVSEDEPVAKSFFCVGDTKQAIYGWRGGVAEIFEAVADEIPNVRQSEQNASFRSSQVVLNTVNDVFQNLHRHSLTDDAGLSDPAEKSMHEAKAIVRFSKSFPSHVSMRPDLSGYVRFETSPKVEGDKQERSRACFQLAAQRIAELNQRMPHAKIAVLTRVNATVGRMIFELEQLGVDVSQEGGNPLTDSPAVELVLSALMLAEHPGDRRWWFHLHQSPLGQIDGMSPTWVREYIQESGLAQCVQCLAGVLAPICDARDTLRLRQLTQLALQYEPNATSRLRDFVRMVGEKRVERPQAAPVRVMTVHKSKGLEFDAVFLPEIDGSLAKQSPMCVADVPHLGQPPVAMSRYISNKSWHFLSGQWQRAFGGHVAGEITEALCLLYVAMTRAKQALYLITPPAKDDTKSPAGLIHQSLGCETSMREGDELLYESGDPEWTTK
ncbi:UvrD-helicase domain-containing protein [Stieleria varia]|uniref:DNA 3'-5' helicase n=1 Tax=Stieleria varia TaxID=2528005 RepID=A0A5C6AS65_9BACT|nr:UvrD-helicase domain-containing protein [Stieleria varia]TWU02341.1 ATP-dependent DNA helicase PcrA [Stieleria varia]